MYRESLLYPSLSFKSWLSSASGTCSVPFVCLKCRLFCLTLKFFLEHFIQKGLLLAVAVPYKQNMMQGDTVPHFFCHLGAPSQISIEYLGRKKYFLSGKYSWKQKIVIEIFRLSSKKWKQSYSDAILFHSSFNERFLNSISNLLPF